MFLEFFLFEFEVVVGVDVIHEVADDCDFNCEFLALQDIFLFLVAKLIECSSGFCNIFFK